jgi:protein TonB
LIDRIRAGAGRRAFGIGLALLMEALLLLALLSLGPGRQVGKEEDGRITVVNFAGERPTEKASKEASPEPQQRAEQQQPAPRQPADVPPGPQAARPLPPAPAQVAQSQAPAPAAPPATVAAPPAAAPSPSIPPARGRPPSPGRAMYGPPDQGGSRSLDTEVVGTAPDGEPLYAAAWHTRPRADQLRGYLATANGPGWGLIACRTAPGFRVEDCVGLSEYPQGSQINRAVLAAAWEFKVRPPRIGGRSLVGSWVRIRIDYTIDRR